jgi:hypothetical protein
VGGGANNAGYIEFRNPAAARLGYIGWAPSYLSMVLETGGLFAITGGNVAIGKSTASYSLDVSGTVAADTFAANGGPALVGNYGGAGNGDGFRAGGYISFGGGANGTLVTQTAGTPSVNHTLAIQYRRTGVGNYYQDALVITDCDYASYAVLQLMPAGGHVYIGKPVARAMSGYKLDVNGSIAGTSFTVFGTSYVFNTDGRVDAQLICSNIDSRNDSGGVSLYSAVDTYGVFFRGTASGSTWGTYGPVTGTWATYFTMSNTAGRGWIFRNQTDGINVAAISNTGIAQFAGSVTATTFYKSSSRALKEGFRAPAFDAWGKIDALAPTHFRYRGETVEDLGFIAEDTDRLFLAPDGKAIDVHRVATALVMDAQAAHRRIERLEAELAQLGGRLG